MNKRQDIERLERKVLAPYATFSGDSRGRQHKETEHPYRTRFQRDRDRVIHTSAFRRLEYKTQVFVYHEGDYYRTRLTHTLEVAQIARSICKTLRLNEDLSEAIALAHDLGHPPFGHTGQKILNRLMKHHGGFEHNKHSLRIVKILEKRYPEFDGLNLTWEVLEGISKHSRDEENPIFSKAENKNPSLEAQVADVADGIAYNAHDLDDGITSGLLEVGALRKVALWNDTEKMLDAKYKGLDFKIKKYQIVRNVINTLIGDFRENTLRNIKKYSIRGPEDVRRCPMRLGEFGPEVREQQQELRKFLHQNMYQHRRVRRMEFKAEHFLTELFAAYMKLPELLPDESAGRRATDERRACDYIAGMTDRYAINEYKKLYSPGEKDEPAVAW